MHCRFLQQKLDQLKNKKEILLKVFPRTRFTRMVFFVVADMISICLAVYLAFFLRFDANIPAQHLQNTIPNMIFLAVIFCLPVFFICRLYSISWSYVSTSDLVTLFKAVTLSFFFIGVIIFLFQGFPSQLTLFSASLFSISSLSLKSQLLIQGFPRSTLFISYFLVFIFCGMIRFSKRIYLHIFKGGNGEEKEKTLIVGAGDAGEQILRSILSSPDSLYFLVGFADDDPAKQGIVIHGVKVLGKIADIPEIVKRNAITEIIIALSSAGSDAIKRAVEGGRSAKVEKIKIIPTIAEVIDGRVSVGDVRDVEVEDLLGRSPVSLDTKSIESFILGKKVLVTGAAGSIGSELSRQTAKFRPSLLLILDQDETGIFNISEELKVKFPRLAVVSLVADIREQKKIRQIFSQFKPDIVFHAAAYKHVALMEKHPEEAIKNNIFGTKNVASAAIDNGAEKFVFISTDKAVNPCSLMGASKRVGEMLCQTLNQEGKTKFVSVRFGNVLDSRGSVIPIFREQIKRGGPVEITHPDMKRYFMVTSEAVLLVMQASAIGEGGEVFALDMGEPIRILDLAREMIKFSGFEPDIDIPIVFTKPYPGEKFFEEILTAEEGTRTTEHKKVFIANLSDVNRNKLNTKIDKLRNAALSMDREKIIKTFKELIPTFKNNN